MQTEMSLLRVIFSLFCIFHLHLAFPVIEKDNEVSQLALLPKNLCPTLICGSSNMTITFLKEELTKLEVNLKDIHLIEPTCKGFEDSEKTIAIQSPTKVQHCGTYVIVNETHAIYKNNIYLSPDPSSVIYREDYMVNVSCIYPLTMAISLGTVLNPIMSTGNIDIVGSGNFEVQMALFKDPAYTIPREKGDLLATEDILYVGVTMTEGDNSQFYLVMKDCFATPTQHFDESVKYYIIKNSCKYENDKTIHVAANGITSYGQFSVQAFKFFGYSHIFLHCQVHLCDHTSGSCFPICNAESRVGPAAPEVQETYIRLGAIAVKDSVKLCPDLQCGTSYINVTLKKNELIDADVDISKLHLNVQNCHDVYDDGKSLSIGWPLGVGKCGTTLTTNGSHAIYGNSIYLGFPETSEIIYRKEYYINISCIYPLDMNISLQNALNPMITTEHINIDGAGSFEVIMAVFKDQAYQEPYQKGEIQLSTESRLFIGVLFSKGDTNHFDLVMQHCYATPNNNPEEVTNYGIIVNGCPNEKDGTIQVYANGISSQGQFSIKMFKFVNYSYVFLHCKVHFCSKSSGSCVPVCPRVPLRSAAPQEVTVSLGPFYRAGLVGENSESTSISTTTTTMTTLTDNDAHSTAAAIIMTTSKAHAGNRTCLDLLRLIAILLFTVIF